MLPAEPWIVRAAALGPDRVAVAADDGELTYAALLARARAVAADLEPGAPVALALAPGLDFAVALHACLLAGAPAVPLDLRLSAEERSLRAAGARVLDRLPDPGARGSAAVAACRTPRPDDIAVAGGRQPRADDVATVMHTSGTTATPKRVELTHSNWWWNAAGSALAIGLDPAERWLCALPLAHVGGLSILTRSAVYATTAVLHARFDAERAARTIVEERITVVSVVATMLARLLDAGLAHPPHLRVALLGGGPAPASLLARAAAAGVPVSQTYGLTETCAQACTSPPGDAADAGLPLPGTRVRIRAREIEVKGPTVAPSAAGPGGWLATGDLGTLDVRGRLTVVGRRADTIVSGGENVAPAEVEAALLAHPDVADVAVYGRPDPEWGEAIVARVVPRAGAHPELADVREFCAARLAAFKLPKALELAATLPRTPTGKLLRHNLRPEG